MTSVLFQIVFSEKEIITTLYSDKITAYFLAVDLQEGIESLPLPKSLLSLPCQNHYFIGWKTALPTRRFFDFQNQQAKEGK